MKIALNDPLWQRLYGPYGVESVPEIITELLSHWDDELAADLFWEKLHHQDTLYPVTYAALPWLWEIVVNGGTPSTDTLIFLSHVCCCAVDHHGDASASVRYNGLSTKIEDHHHVWIDEAQRLTEIDIEKLKALETWFSDRAENIAELCICAMPSDDRQIAAMLAAGVAGLRGSPTVAQAMSMWADGEYLATILDELGKPTEIDIEVSQVVIKFAQIRNEPLSKFLCDWIKL